MKNIDVNIQDKVHNSINKLINKYNVIQFLSKTQDGETALIKASWTDNKKIVEMLINQPNINVNVKDNVNILNQIAKITIHVVFINMLQQYQ